MCDSVSSDYQGTVLLHSREEQWTGSYFGTAVSMFSDDFNMYSKLVKICILTEFGIVRNVSEMLLAVERYKDEKVRCPSVA